ncbi:hypothetical protein [Vagococcus salmoninarum]|uniref:Uncharacterized protein n=1 Tax=Vagococcus salmoninarum TaxID=2739 RepID=A0A429ZQZ3_9ENTE|nr:hypothetical protein [Vagococcus salmoninarum]MBE9387692.1 hypothetical protein [Vagococcus salmoninarum]RST96085.1 hypothetical protein CBF35_06710 [Vagococcus salmoninarum]
MAKEKPTNSVKILTKLISDSSQKLLAAFINDDIKLSKDRDKLRKKINLACSENSFVVIHIAESNDPNQPFETVAGKLRANENNPDIIILSDQKTQSIRMIPINSIRKISFLKSKIANSTKKRQIT